MFVNVASNSNSEQVIENLSPAFILVFCVHIVIAIERLLENVSVDFGIMIEQCFEAIEVPICASHAQQETANRHFHLKIRLEWMDVFILSIGVRRNFN